MRNRGEWFNRSSQGISYMCFGEKEAGEKEWERERPHFHPWILSNLVWWFKICLQIIWHSSFQQVELNWGIVGGLGLVSGF